MWQATSQLRWIKRMEWISIYSWLETYSLELFFFVPTNFLNNLHWSTTDREKKIRKKKTTTTLRLNPSGNVWKIIYCFNIICINAIGRGGYWTASVEHRVVTKWLVIHFSSFCFAPVLFLFVFLENFFNRKIRLFRNNEILHIFNPT